MYCGQINTSFLWLVPFVSLNPSMPRDYEDILFLKTCIALPLIAATFNFLETISLCYEVGVNYLSPHMETH